MTKEEINVILRRRIKPGLQYNDLIEKNPNQQIPLEKGNTFYSVRKMKLFVDTYYRQVSNLAPALLGNNLQETCHNIHQFLYNYIQYNIDAKLQKLRSPANSWKNRSFGIDCKSYSIFASAILKNLGIKHCIRQIKQVAHEPTRFTHVYIVVPVNQKTGSVENVYTIDGTIDTMKEPSYTTKSDTIMDELPHIGLNAVTTKKSSKAKTTKAKTMAKNSKAKAPSTRARFPF